MNKCNRCKLEKPIIDFTKINKSGDEKILGSCSICRIIQNEETKKRYKENPEKAKQYIKEYAVKNKEKRRETCNKWARNNEERRKINAINYAENNVELIKQRAKEYNVKNREKLSKMQKQKYEDNKHDPEFRKKLTISVIKYVKKREKIDETYRVLNRARARVSRRLRDFLKGGKEKSTIDYLGCSIEDFWEHMKSKNKDITIDDIHLDHIKPVSLFKEDEIDTCFHYTNYQPLSKKDNLDKSNKWDEKDEEFWKNNIIFNEEYKDIYIPNI
jgi:hypothetical protein